MPDESPPDQGEPRHRADTGSVPVQAAKQLHKPWKWLIGGVAAALTAVLIATLSTLPEQLVDVPRLQDKVRTTDDLAITITRANDQGLWAMISRERFTMPLEQGSMTVTPAVMMEQIIAAGGADLGRLRLLMVLEGRSAQGLRVTDIRPVNVNRSAPPGGTRIYINDEGGPERTDALAFDLDKRTLVAQRLTKNEPAGRFFEGVTIPLPDREQVALILQFDLTKYELVTFDLQVTYLIGAEQRTKVFNDKGRPFAITGENCTAKNRFEYKSAYGWTPEGKIGEVPPPGKACKWRP